MSQLHAILSTLSATEHAKVKKIRIIGTERQIFEYIMSFKNNELPDVKEISKTLQITPNHYYKACSVLLNRIYECLVPNMGIDLLKFLSRKDLYNLLSHEIYMQEKQLLSGRASLQQMADFYWNCYTILLRVGARDFQEDLVLEYGDKYLKSKINKDVHESILIRNMYIASMMLYLRATKKGIERATQLVNELHENEETLRKSTLVLAKFYLHEAYKNYYTHLSFEANKVLHYTERNIQLMDQYPDMFTQEQIALNACKLAEMHLANSKFSECVSSYNDIFTRYAEVLEGDFYHHAKWFQAALILEDFEKASKILQQKFEHFLGPKKNTASLIAAILYLKFYLIQQKTEQAEKYIDLAYKALKKNNNEQYDMEVRILEIIYYLFSNKKSLAVQTIRKHVKYMNNRGYNIRNSQMYAVFLILQEYSRHDFDKRGLSLRHANRLALLQQSYAAVYGKLLNQLQYKYQR